MRKVHRASSPPNNVSSLFLKQKDFFFILNDDLKSYGSSEDLSRAYRIKGKQCLMLATILTEEFGLDSRDVVEFTCQLAEPLVDWCTRFPTSHALMSCD